MSSLDYQGQAGGPLPELHHDSLVLGALISIRCAITDANLRYTHVKMGLQFVRVSTFCAL